MSHTTIGVVVPSVIPCCSSCGTSWRRQDSNLRLRGYEPRGLTELPYSAPAPDTSESQRRTLRRWSVYRSNRDAVSGGGLGIDVRRARHRTAGVFGHYVAAGAAGCLVWEAARPRAGGWSEDQQGCRRDHSGDAEFHMPSKVRRLVRFEHWHIASAARTLESTATARHADYRSGGLYRDRTGDLSRATEACYQLCQQPNTHARCCPLKPCTNHSRRLCGPLLAVRCQPRNCSCERCATSSCRPRPQTDSNRRPSR